LLNEKLDKKYYYINAESSNKFFLINTRIMKKGTTFHENTFKNIKMDIPLGIFVDIFPFDNIPDSLLERKVQALEISFLCKLLILKYIPFPYMRIEGWKAKLARVICCMIHYMIFIIHIPRKTIINRCRKVMTRYENSDTEMLSSLTDTNPLEQAMTKDVFLPLKKVEFEGMQISTINDPHSFLTYRYCDYMQLPPIEKRKMHTPYKLDFGKKVEEIKN
jgi:lipopolysaccharide cholinephosphotransferase